MSSREPHVEASFEVSPVPDRPGCVEISVYGGGGAYEESVIIENGEFLLEEALRFFRQGRRFSWKRFEACSFKELIAGKGGS